VFFRPIKSTNGTFYHFYRIPESLKAFPVSPVNLVDYPLRISFTEKYYNRLWLNGRLYPGLRAESILKGATSVAVDPEGYAGFYKYVYDGWEMIYNPTTKIVSHMCYE
jgi:hypothetical protein